MNGSRAVWAPTRTRDDNKHRPAKKPSMKIKVISNLPRLAEVRSERFEIEVLPIGRVDGLRALLGLFLKSFRYDYVLLNGSGRLVFQLAFLKWLVPFNRTRLVVLDILLSTPVTARDRLKAFVTRILFKKVHRFLLYYRDTGGLQKVYGIAPEKFRYVPFKINQIERVQAAVPSDGGYIFCGGKTRRDFDTLFEAVRGTDLPVRVVTTDNADIREHGSYLDRSAAPANVEIVILDGSFEKFLEQMAAARIVAMPIIPEICGAGIGVYIMAMALRKCVVISDIPGTRDTVPPGTLVIVPPRDPAALRDALLRAFHDADYRAGCARAGYAYAVELGGEDRLLHSVAWELYSDTTA